MGNRFFLYFSLLFCATSFAQEILLKGQLTNTEDIEGIHILNTTSRFNAVTNENGYFEIEAKLKDTLVFSSVKYYPKKVVVKKEAHDYKYIEVTLVEVLNELDEVYLGHGLTGNIEKDIKNIKTEDTFNFDDVGIPGFKGEPEEKIPPVIGGVVTINTVNVEALYKYISGYYKTLRTKRKWEVQNKWIAEIFATYEPAFFEEAYEVPQNRAYEFLLFCMETSTLQSDFKNENFNGVLTIFKTNAVIYNKRNTGN